MIRARYLKACVMLVLIIISLLCNYGGRILYDFFAVGAKKSGYESGNVSEDIPESGNITEDLEFRYAWHRINQQSAAFQPFWYLIEPAICTENKTAAMLLYVATTPDERGFTTRNSIRSTWASEARMNNIEVIFSMGRRTNSLNQNDDIAALLLESKRFNDILLASYTDRWENLILKWWSNNNYHFSRCSHISLMASMDSDTVIFGKKLKNLLDNSSHTFDGYLGCQVISAQPAIRESLSRYYVSEKQWPEKRLPTYCSGIVIIENVQACKRIAEVVPQLGIHYISQFKIFDVITGAIARAAGLELRNVNGIFPWLPVADICYPTLFAMHAVASNLLVDFFQYRNVVLKMALLITGSAHLMELYEKQTERCATICW